MIDKPRAWFDENYVLCFRDDVEEKEELEELMTAAFYAGMRNMAAQMPGETDD